MQISHKADEDWAGCFRVQGNLSLHLCRGILDPVSVAVHEVKPLEHLHEPADDVLQLHPGKGLPEANSGAVIEGNKFPGARGPGFPAVGVEFVGRGANEIMTALEAHVGQN